LRTLPEGIRLVQTPAKAVIALGEKHQAWPKGSAPELNKAIAKDPIRSHSFRLTANFETANSRQVGIRLLKKGGTYTQIGFDSGRNELYVDRSHSGRTNFSKDFPARVAAPLHVGSPKLRLEVLVDRSSIEVFAYAGHVVLTNLVFPDDDAYGLEAFSSDGSSTVELESWTLRSVWSGSSAAR